MCKKLYGTLIINIEIYEREWGTERDIRGAFTGEDKDN